MALAILGYFVFQTATVPFQGYERGHAWRHPSQNTVGGGIPPVQYTGKENETVSISAELRPEITGGDTSLALLRMMAEEGKPYNLIMGNGDILGAYVITAIKEGRKELMWDGKARSISFSMELKKVSDSPLGMYGAALTAAVSTVRQMVGI
ncbi:phage tail protein [Neisseria dentiae]|uniref:phage tail protein n=1 Tax=Neisseria dentiae TaxID=194197 RepID=UPI0035A0D107